MAASLPLAHCAGVVGPAGTDASSFDAPPVEAGSWDVSRDAGRTHEDAFAAVPDTDATCAAPAAVFGDVRVTPATLRLRRWLSAFETDGEVVLAEVQFPADTSTPSPSYRVGACEIDPRAFWWDSAGLGYVEVSLAGRPPRSLHPGAPNRWGRDVPESIEPGESVRFFVTPVPDAGLEPFTIEGFMPPPLASAEVLPVEGAGTALARRDRPLRFRWQPLCGERVTIVLSGPGQSWVTCDASGADGQFEVPASTMALFRPSDVFRVTVKISRRRVTTWGPYRRVELAVEQGVLGTEGRID